ncbi:uncharacterized protein LOC124361866 isoform X1 [Homalodisca vitripennis]|uniref:uncharacterized protein LOC124361866 isoform X1 n=1 Tax=Homalodisca vitripennis TaxID=197043 RepID=UPI001EECA251|nr:uncharacterized protein LOC124361866 isoform X1 [Homalodisca vitripennis]
MCDPNARIHRLYNYPSPKLPMEVLKSLTNLKRRIAAAVLHEKPTRKPVRVTQLSQCPYHLSITSLDKHHDSHSIDTVMTWLDEGSLLQEISDNRLNERLEMVQGST